MAFPPNGSGFSVASFFSWLKSKGISVHSGYSQKVGGKIRTMTKIESSDGRMHAFVPNSQLSIMPLNAIVHYCGKLGINHDDFIFQKDSVTCEEHSGD